MGKNKTQRSTSLAPSGKQEQQISEVDKDDIDTFLLDFLRHLPEDERETMLPKLKSKFQKRRMTVNEIKCAVKPETVNGESLNKDRDSSGLLADLRELNDTIKALDEIKDECFTDSSKSKQTEVPGNKPNVKTKKDTTKHSTVKAEDDDIDKMLTEILSLIADLNSTVEPNKDLESKEGEDKINKKKSKEKKKKEKKKKEKKLNKRKGSQLSNEIFLGLDFKVEDLIAIQDNVDPNKSDESKENKNGEMVIEDSTNEDDRKEKKAKKKSGFLGGLFKGSKAKKEEIQAIDASNNDCPEPDEDANEDECSENLLAPEQANKKVKRKVSFKDEKLMDRNALTNIKHIENDENNEINFIIIGNDEKSKEVAEKSNWFGFQMLGSSVIIPSGYIERSMGFAKSYGSQMKTKIQNSLRDRQTDENTCSETNVLQRNRRQSLGYKIMKLGCFYA